MRGHSALADGEVQPEGAGVAGPSSNEPNRSSWPIASCLLHRHDRVDRRVVHGGQATAGCARGVSNAPALISDSMARLLQTRISNLSRKSEKEVYLPLDLREPTIESMTLAPTLRTRLQAEADVLADGGEVGDRLVDVRGQHLDAELAALGQVDGGLVLVVADRGEQRGHVLGRVVGLEVGGPVRDQSVAGGVRLVERVTGEGQHDVPERLDRLVGVLVAEQPGVEVLELLGQDLFLLLAHRAAQQVGAAERVAGQLGGDGMTCSW